ncbi:hypothetical protein XENOCAPTIV_007290, partial [Xenoophorus captivus]
LHLNASRSFLAGSAVAEEHEELEKDPLRIWMTKGGKGYDLQRLTHDSQTTSAKSSWMRKRTRGVSMVKNAAVRAKPRCETEHCIIYLPRS